MENSELSLGLITKNQSMYLKSFIENYLVETKSLPLAIPLIIVNDGSTDGTRDFLENLADKHSGILVLNLYSSGRASARNKVLEACNTKWLAFTDTDCVFGSGYFKRLLLIPQKFTDFPAVEGYVFTDNFNPYAGVTHYVDNTMGGMFITANMVFNVPKILKLGGFNLKYKNFREDVDLGLRIKKTGQIPFWDELKIRHPRISLHPKDCFIKANSYWKEIIQSEYFLFLDHPAAYRKVRRYETFRLTLNHWCKWYALGKLKNNARDGIKYLASRPLDPAALFQTVKYFLGLFFIWGFVFLWEQIIIIYHGKLNKSYLK